MFRAGIKKSRSDLRFNKLSLYVAVIWNVPVLDKENPNRVINCRTLAWWLCFYRVTQLRWVRLPHTDCITTVRPTWSETSHKADYDKDDHNKLYQNLKKSHDLFQANFRPFHTQRPTCTLSASCRIKRLITRISDINESRVNDANTNACHWTWLLARDQSTPFLMVFKNTGSPTGLSSKFCKLSANISTLLQPPTFQFEKLEEIGKRRLPFLWT
jgi:hypothetical protein